jgi:TolB-like protein
MMGGFFRELKRRRVLRTAALYVAGAWIALQVVEVLAGAGLPPGTMRQLLVALSAGFPLVLVVGWYFDITANGITRTGPLARGESSPDLQFADYILVVALLLVVATDAYILSLPPPAEAALAVASTPQHRTIAVLAFDDADEGSGRDPIGTALAGELRSSLTRTAGLRVLGPETSRMLLGAGENILTIAAELGVEALLQGAASIVDGELLIDARLRGVPAGNKLWSARVTGPISNAVSLQERLIKQIVAAAAPNLDPDPLQGPRMRAGDCDDVYDMYLRGKQMTKAAGAAGTEARAMGRDLLREAVAINDRCAIAWEALAVSRTNWTLAGFAEAGAAARRALEINEALPEAWTVLAEIAEEEERWDDSEEFFLRALYADPTNARAHEYYGEALAARGRVKEALRHALEAYRYEPGSKGVNFHASFAAKLAGDGELTIKHATINDELRGLVHPVDNDQRAEGYLLKGDTERALEEYRQLGDKLAPWFLECVRVRNDAEIPESLRQAVRDTAIAHRGTKFRETEGWLAWNIIRCGTWIGEADLVAEILLGTEGVPTEVKYLLTFFPDAKLLRQHPQYRALFRDSGLVDYWRKWGWSDYCEPVGEDDFRCD